MLYAGLDLSRQRLDVHVLDEAGRTVEVTAVRPDGDALRTLATHVLRQGQAVSAAIESMTGARFVHDTLEFAGWDVAIADAAKVKGIAPLAAKTDKIDASGPSSASAGSAVRRSPGSTSPASSPKPSGTSSPGTNPSPRQAPLCFWSLDDPPWNWAAGAASRQTLSFSQKAIER